MADQSEQDAMALVRVVGKPALRRALVAERAECARAIALLLLDETDGESARKTVARGLRMVALVAAVRKIDVLMRRLAC